MEPHGRAAIRFTLNGQRYELTREDVENRLTDVAPDAIRKHAVKVSGTWFPVIQAFEAATGIPRSEFISHTARRHLAALGYEVAGDVQPHASQPTGRGAQAPPATPGPRGGKRRTWRGSGTPKPTSRPPW